MRLLRVFPQKNKATPTDDMAFVGTPPLFRPEADEVRISCTFTWDKPKAEYLRTEWGKYYSNVKMGGPAYDDPGGDFVPGRYIKQGYVITSRGCPNRCSYCYVPKREGKLRLLPITNGNDVIDNNLLACPREHIEAVLDMLQRQSEPARFTGGLDARLIKEWFVVRVAKLKSPVIFTAYDRPGDLDPVVDAIKLFTKYGLRNRNIGCYVLVGHKNDTKVDANRRLTAVKDAGGTPFAMYFRGDSGKLIILDSWKRFIRAWSRPAMIYSQNHDEIIEKILADEI